MRSHRSLPVVEPPEAGVIETSEDLTRILTTARRIAVVGLSSSPWRPSHGVARRLLELGYEVVPVNPNETEVLGLPAVPALADVPGPIDIVDVFRRPVFAPDVARQAVEVGARVLWLQSGVTSDEARRIATDGGLDYIEDACLGVVASSIAGPAR
jgi:uncharacterized protein